MAELEARADAQGLDWKSQLSDLPSDDWLGVAALATMLKIDALRAIQADSTLDALEEEARAARAAAREGEAEMRKYVSESPAAGGVSAE